MISSEQIPSTSALAELNSALSPSSEQSLLKMSEIALSASTLLVKP